ncbi:ATP-binding cassette domain-containing protein [Dethiosulfatarculus sandiegensis]|nr:ATP-binding cassette domain-containing protein [Dethiosulfatarculus sandiegensis]
MAYGKLVLMNGLSFCLKPGQVVGLSGKSGAGKTTLLRLAAGLTRPEEGRINNFAGKTGFVFQEPRLLPWRTARQNVALALMAVGTQKTRALKQAGQMLECMELDGFLDAYPNRLSGGMQQRVSLARALALEPDLLLLDEPTSALDQGLKTRMSEMIRELAREKGAAVLFSSHSEQELKNTADWILRFKGKGLVEISD